MKELCKYSKNIHGARIIINEDGFEAAFFKLLTDDLPLKTIMFLP